jgi:hypothetical protein
MLESMLLKWVRGHEANPGSAFPGHGVMKTEQQELDRLGQESAKLVTEALLMAIWRRGKSDTLLHHRDQDRQ